MIIIILCNICGKDKHSAGETKQQENDRTEIVYTSDIIMCYIIGNISQVLWGICEVSRASMTENSCRSAVDHMDNS
jgi:hypothetical protein